MTYLFYSSSSISYPHFGVQLNQALQKYDDGHKVVFAYCDGVMDTCFKNVNSSPLICQACKLGYRTALNKYKDKFEIIKLNRRKNRVSQSFTYSSIEDIKSIKYHSVEVGYAVLAYYISITRNPDFELTRDIIEYLDRLIDQTCGLVDSALELIDQVNPDSICVFNGRFFESKPFFELAKLYNIEVVVNEVIGTGKVGSPIYITDFMNALPHDIPNFAQKIRYTWDNSPYENTVKMRIGESFYANKREGIDTALINYTKEQKLGLLPETWDSSKRNIVIFNSSEDEYAAIGEEFASYALFSSQLEGIHYILKETQASDFQFYLRIHPNLKNVAFSFHRELLLLGEIYSNCTVIKADDEISTYTLIDACWKVVVFGSTVGIESVFWRKPAILLAGSMYHDLNALYKPKNKEELLQLLSADLKVLDTESAIMFGYYFMDREVSHERPTKIDLDLLEYNLLKWNFYQPRYQSLLGMNLLFKIATFVLITIGRLKLKNNKKFVI